MAYSNINIQGGQAAGGAWPGTPTERLIDAKAASGTTAPTRPIPAALDELSNTIGDVNALLEAVYTQLSRAGVLKPSSPDVAGGEMARGAQDPQSEMEARIRDMTSRLHGTASGLRAMLTHLQL